MALPLASPYSWCSEKEGEQESVYFSFWYALWRKRFKKKGASIVRNSYSSFSKRLRMNSTVCAEVTSVLLQAINTGVLLF
jgi:hypothetical protein